MSANDRYSPDLLPIVFGDEWDKLNADQVKAIRQDFQAVVDNPGAQKYRVYATPREWAYDYRMRIGQGNLLRYAQQITIYPWE